MFGRWPKNLTAELKERYAAGTSSSRSDPGKKNVGVQCEVRPGGLLLQKRNPDSSHPWLLPIRLQVKYGPIYLDIRIESHATFGDLKKLLSPPTGLHHDDQKVFFKNKEMDSRMCLDAVGVKDRSKMVVVEDTDRRDRRRRELLKAVKASKSVSEISLELDRLAGRVLALESIITRGQKVEVTELNGLVGLLMNQLVKLGAIVAKGDVRMQRKIQVKRVQRYVETLDKLTIKNKALSNNNKSTGGPSTVLAESGRSSLATVVTTEWETFEDSPSEEQTQVPSVQTNKSPSHQSITFPWDFD